MLPKNKALEKVSITGVLPYVKSPSKSGLFIIDCALPSTLEEINFVNQLFPNPAQYTFTIESENATLFELFNTLGKKVKEINITNKQTKIQRDELASGLYFYILKDKYNKTGSGKVIFK